MIFVFTSFENMNNTNFINIIVYVLFQVCYLMDNFLYCISQNTGYAYFIYTVNL